MYSLAPVNSELLPVSSSAWHHIMYLFIINKAFNFVPAVKNSVTSKFSHKSAGSLLALGSAGLTYFLTSFAVISSVKSESNRIINRNSHPGWYQKDRVVNADRVFFELDDHKDNGINIIHSGL